MAKEKKSTKGHDAVDVIEQDLTKAELFLQKNQNIIFGVLVAIILLVAAFWAYGKYIKEPREKEAKAQMFMAERFFAADSFNLALNGYQSYLGFLQIIDNYKGTQAANLAYYYAGVSYANLGQWQNAIDYLKKFDTEDPILASVQYGLMGDSYLQLGDENNAVKYYKKSTDEYSNHTTTPIYLKKLGLLYEKQGKYQKALDTYNRIFDEFAQSNEARTIEKYIDRAKLHLEK